MILGLALIPSKDFQDEVNAYRKRYDNHYAIIMPHITIKGQFEIKDSDLESVKEEIKARVEGVSAVDVHATKASTFAPITNVIYFKVAKTEALEKLFNNFNKGDFYGEPDHPFVPHFTIAQGLTSQEFEDVYGQLKLAGIDYKETIDQLSLVYFNEEEEKWQLLENYNLA
ncbi:MULTISPECIES: YjcG family protein [Staphylococcus]|uniref:Putative phosphoesterase QQM35_06440 n=1 Tax=Staphylococcus hsinchuensis TaxID=3051183 RepID=A0ABZ3EA45_9STAP|nr:MULTISPECIES: YjcG family protein [unclassified Staphylococcus]